MNNNQEYYESLYRKNTSSSSSTDEIDITYIDTVKVEEIISDLKRLSDEYTSVISKLFVRFSEVPNITGEWIGDQANRYFTAIAQDKNNLIGFGNNMKNIINKLDYDINQVTDSVGKTTRLESEARYNDEI